MTSSVTSIESTISLLPAIPINGSHIADTKVTPLEDGPSQPLKATQAMRCAEEELGRVEKNFEFPRNHSGIATRANEDEYNDEN